ncbi:hypothetical protein SOVF_145330 [Spinacia oleracea]|nr:hypothetical protein SOVF_145330 [Spinacia oleracea]
MDQIHNVIENSCYQQYQESETMEACFDEQVADAAVIGEDFRYSVYDTSDDTASPPLDFLVDQFITTPHISDDNNIKNDVEESQPPSKEQALRGVRKRKRQPGKVQDHILAERRRRELLSQLFISLSALVPGLKKIDKISVLVEAIKHMKQLQEKVKVLEEVAAKRTVVVKKSKVMVDDNNNSSDDNVSSSTVADDSPNASSGSRGNGGGGGGGGGDNVSSFPEIDVMISGKALLLRVYCEKQKGIVAKLFAEIDKHDLKVTTSSVIPFENLALDITIVAQMERGFNHKNVKDFVRTLRKALRLASYQCNESSEDEH